MPLPIPSTPSPPIETPPPAPEVQAPVAVLEDPSRAQPYWQRQPELWAEAQVANSHVEALALMGEYAMFVLLWHPADHEAGLVERCSRCFAPNSYSARMAAVYDQPTEARCPSCLGTTFEGGYRARIVRPSLWTDSATDTVTHPRGDVQTDSMAVETTGDFTMRHGDFVLRADGTRYRSLELTGAWLRTGMARPARDRSVGGAIAQVRLENPTSVAYTIPPVDPAELVEALALPATKHLMPDPAAESGYGNAYLDLYAYYEQMGYEHVRGPLVLPQLPQGTAP